MVNAGDSRAVAEDVRSEIADVARTGMESARHAVESIRSGARKAAEQAGYAKDKLCRTIEEYPLTSVAVAFGLGVLVMRLLRR
jgi:ElaB/YqjD/DUF883 family membrane-anchored ribosome-binding protein